MKGIEVSREERTMDVVSLPKANFDRALSSLIESSYSGTSGDPDLPPARGIEKEICREMKSVIGHFSFSHSVINLRSLI
jgi:hypothetical protein